jgi:inhibitor of cysteine peptidase
MPTDGSASPPNANDGDESPSGSGGYSDTNLQEAGVDESDKVKTDGNVFYIADGKSFHVVDISADMEVVATLSVDGYVDSLFLYDDKLVVLYESMLSDGGPWIDIPMPDMAFGMPYWIPAKKSQGVAVYDVSDPNQLVNLKTVEFDGHLISSRRVEGKLHIVQQFMPELPPLYNWFDGTKADKENKINANRKAIDEMTLDQLIPYYRVVSDLADAQWEGPIVSSENFFCPVSKDGGGTITTIVTFNLDDASLPFESIGMVMDGHIVYASTKALYIANQRYFFREDVSELSMIYKFDLTGEEVRFSASNILQGWILNQFSLGEFEDVLRVATTVGRIGGWGPESQNNVYCLQAKDENLKIIGELKNLAPGEQIYAARFMGNRGYLVTFVKIDPLFTLDLSNPAAPKVAGELKVPGFSDYIHPYGDDYLITVGKDALPADEGNFAWYQGVQLSIFDVRDFSNPALLHKEIIGDRGTITEAAYNHKAFTFWAEKELLALPLELSEHLSPPAYPYSHGTQTFRGLYVYRVSSNTGFSFLGRIDTEPEPETYQPYFFNPWTRSVFVDKQVYAVTSEAVWSALIDQIDQEGIQTVYLPKLEDGN